MTGLTREERRSLALHRAIADRLRADAEPGLARARRVLAIMEAQHPQAAPLLSTWRVLLAGPLETVLQLLEDPSPLACELRHVTPFAGVLSARERTAVYQAFRVAEAAGRPTATGEGGRAA